jgi:hypothetical protein
MFSEAFPLSLKKKSPPRELALPTALWNRRKGFPRKFTVLLCRQWA